MLRVALVLGWLALPVLAAAGVDGRLTVERNPTVNGAVVRVGDVAVLEGQARAFGDVELGVAPEPGSTRRLSGVAILQRLSDAGMDATTLRYQIPATVVVSRAYQEIGASELARLAEERATALLAPGERLRSVDVGNGARIPPGAFEARVEPVGPARGTSRRFELTLLQEGTAVATVPVRADIAAFGPVVTARRTIARGDVITADDLGVEERDLAGTVAVVRDAKDAIGKEARVAIAAGAPIPPSALATPLLVRRGDVVTLVVDTPGMRVSLPGEALEAGAAGTQVRVLNTRSKQEIAGRVVERGTILVQY